MHFQEAASSEDVGFCGRGLKGLRVLGVRVLASRRFQVYGFGCRVLVFQSVELRFTFG